MDFRDDSSATELPDIPPSSKPATQLEPQSGDIEQLGHLPPLPEGDIFAIPATEEPRSVHEPRRTLSSKVRVFTNYSLALFLFFMAFFAVGVTMATLLWTGDMDPMMDLVKSIVRSLKP